MDKADTMNASMISNQFLKGSSIKELSKIYNVEEITIKKLLIKKFGKNSYLKISRANGGKVVAAKLKDPLYRSKYTIKMSKS